MAYFMDEAFVCTLSLYAKLSECCTKQKQRVWVNLLFEIGPANPQ